MLKKLSYQQKHAANAIIALFVGGTFAETIFVPIIAVAIIGYSLFKGQLWELDPEQWKED
jgi:hypothetical protein